jgi:hypothetical protein
MAPSALLSPTPGTPRVAGCAVTRVYRITDRHGGVSTIGSCATKPGIVTSVVEECRITLDQRHLDAAGLANLLGEARAASERFATEGGVQVSWGGSGRSSRSISTRTCLRSQPGSPTST